MHGNDFPLGWALSPKENTYAGRWPHLSREESSLVKEVLEHFYVQPLSRQTQEALKGLFSAYCGTNTIHIDTEQQSYLETVLIQHALKAGPLTPLLHDPTLEEIAITGIGTAHPVRVFAVGEGWVNTPLYFTDEKQTIHLLNRLALNSGKRLSASTPTLNVQLDGNYRLHASMYPVCLSLVEASIRKYVVHASEPKHLLQANTISPFGLAYLTMALHADCNILIVGNTGSGKTTTLNALLGGLPQNERLILVEETPELKVSHEHVVRLTPQGENTLNMSALIRETLRMRPDRVVVGEIRFPEEGKAFMESILAGQGKGTYATFHGHTSQEALSRLRQFGLLESDLGWINILVVQRRWTQHTANGKVNEVRKICEIGELIQTKKEK